MKNADLADKKVIERILKIASKKNALENSLKKTLLPDAKESVEQWLKDANENGNIITFIAIDYRSFQAFITTTFVSISLNAGTVQYHS